MSGEAKYSIQCEESESGYFSNSTVSNQDHEYQSNSSAASNIPEDHYYKMNHPRRGECIIINNYEFDKEVQMKERTGSIVDNMNLKAIFESLRFHVTTHGNRTLAQMLKIVEETSKQDHSKNDCLVMVLLSHGDDDGRIYGTDGLIKIDNLIDPLKGNKVSSLRGKPKLFFIQACRGKEFDEGVIIKDEDYEKDAKEIKDEKNMRKIPAEADFLYCYSTAPGYVSFRNSTTGSWYIQALKRVFERCAMKYDLLHLLTLVNCEVASNYESKSKMIVLSNKKQIPTFISMLTRLVKFS